MTRITRRTAIGSALAAVSMTGAPGVVRAQSKPAANRTVRAVFHGDIPTFDPIWTTANMSAYHGAMVYDTLFGIDENEIVKPQMVSKYGLSDDKKTWTFELRDGLKWHDGTAVTTADVVPSIRRWAARDGAGQHMMLRVADISAKDDKTFTINLKEPYGLVLDALGKTGTPLCFIMRKKEAETDPMQKIGETVGSGPFKLNMDETRVGTQYVYDRNPDYVPRSEPPGGIAGGKVVKLDRVVFINMPDAQTAVNAVQTGEIDFYELPPIDLLPQIESDPNLATAVLFKQGNVGLIRLNYLHPPFNNVKVRQAMLHIVKQQDHMKATFADKKYYRECGSLFACGTPMENDANTDWFKKGQDIARAKELLKEGNYDGKPVVLLQATNIAYMSNSATLLAQEMRQAGFNVEIAPMDWSGVVQRRAVKAPPDQGGWNIFITSAGGAGVGNPITMVGHASTGEKGWFGWPSDEKHEALRNKWAAAPTLEERKAIAREMQENAWNYVPMLYFGQWLQPAVYRKNLKGLISVPEVIPWWNVEKV